MDGEWLKWAIVQGGFAAAFVAMFYFNKQVMDCMLTVVKENTASNTRMIVLLEAVHRRLDEGHIQVDGRKTERS